MLTKNLANFGSDPEFYKELSHYALENGVGEVKIENFDYSKGRILEACVTFSSHVVFIDLTFIQSIHDLLDEIIYIKRNRSFVRILFVAVFSDQDLMNKQLKLLLTAGFQLFFIKGSETNTLFRDCFYVAFDDSSDFPAFAKARKIDKNIYAGACSTLSSIDETTFTLETDLESPDDQLNLSLSIFPDLTTKSFKVKDRNQLLVNYPMTTSYLLELPLAGPWSEASTELLQEDTLETWKSHNQEMICEEPKRIKVFSKNSEFFKEIYQYYDPSSFHISFFDDVSFETPGNDSYFKEDHLIFFDLKITPEDNGNLEKLHQIVASVTADSNIKAIIISINNPSTTQAIQKLTNYSNIICSDKALNGLVFSSLTKNYNEKRKKTESQHYIFRPSVPDRSLDVKFEVFLTSLTEHEITFYSTIALPMFSLLHFKLPIEFIATIVPPIIDLPNRAESVQYMAFINGIDEKGFALLRKFVNQIIYSPLPDCNGETISRALDRMNSEKPKKEDVILKLPHTRKEMRPEDEINDFIKENRFKGKSKL